MKYSIFLLSLILMLVGCQKDATPILYMSGHIYDNCYDRTPLRNGIIRLFGMKYGDDQKGKVVAYDSTDENGYFKIFFPRDREIYYMKLQTIRGNDLMQEIPATSNMENVEVFATIYTHIRVSLNVINPHVEKDSLIIGNFSNGGSELKIPCPLNSGYLYTATNWSPIEAMGYAGTNEKIGWYFKPYTGFTYSQRFKIDKYCTDTVDVIVDIK